MVNSSIPTSPDHPNQSDDQTSEITLQKKLKDKNNKIYKIRQEI